MYNSYLAYSSPVPCPRCDTLNNQVRDECRFCGCPMQNWCSDEDCETLNLPKARYCKKCGKPTLFSKYKVFDDVQCLAYSMRAIEFYLLYGDPDAEKANPTHPKEHYNYDDDDFPEPPLDPDYIPYY